MIVPLHAMVQTNRGERGCSCACTGAVTRAPGFRLPQMGYNTLYDVGCGDQLGEQSIHATAAAIRSSKLYAAGTVHRVWFAV